MTEHLPLRSGTACTCGWNYGLSLNDTRSDMKLFLDHFGQIVAEEALTGALHPEFGTEWREPDGVIWKAVQSARADMANARADRWKARHDPVALTDAERTAIRQTLVAEWRDDYSVLSLVNALAVTVAHIKAEAVEQERAARLALVAKIEATLAYWDGDYYVGPAVEELREILR